MVPENPFPLASRGICTHRHKPQYTFFLNENKSNVKLQRRIPVYIKQGDSINAHMVRYKRIFSQKSHIDKLKEKSGAHGDDTVAKSTFCTCMKT